MNLIFDFCKGDLSKFRIFESPGIKKCAFEKNILKDAIAFTRIKIHLSFFLVNNFFKKFFPAYLRTFIYFRNYLPCNKKHRQKHNADNPRSNLYFLKLSKEYYPYVSIMVLATIFRLTP